MSKIISAILVISSVMALVEASAAPAVSSPLRSRSDDEDAARLMNIDVPTWLGELDQLSDRLPTISAADRDLVYVTIAAEKLLSQALDASFSYPAGVKRSFYPNFNLSRSMDERFKTAIRAKTLALVDVSEAQIEQARMSAPIDPAELEQHEGLRRKLRYARSNVGTILGRTIEYFDDHGSNSSSGASPLIRSLREELKTLRDRLEGAIESISNRPLDISAVRDAFDVSSLEEEKGASFGQIDEKASSPQLEVSLVRDSTFQDDIVAARVFGIAHAKWTSELSDVAEKVRIDYEAEQRKLARRGRREKIQESMAGLVPTWMTISDQVTYMNQLMNRLDLSQSLGEAKGLTESRGGLAARTDSAIAARIVTRWLGVLIDRRPVESQIQGLAVYPGLRYTSEDLGAMEEALKTVLCQRGGIRGWQETNQHFQLGKGAHPRRAYERVSLAISRLDSMGPSPIGAWMRRRLLTVLQAGDGSAFDGPPKQGPPGPREPNPKAVAASLPKDVLTTDEVFVTLVHQLKNPALDAAMDLLYANRVLRVNPRRFIELRFFRKRPKDFHWRSAQALMAGSWRLEFLEEQLAQAYRGDAPVRSSARWSLLLALMERQVGARCQEILTQEANAIAARVLEEQRLRKIAEDAVENAKVEKVRQAELAREALAEKIEAIERRRAHGVGVAHGVRRK